MAAPRTNLLLQSLSPASRDRILALSKDVELPVKMSLEEPDEFSRFAYFMTSGIASVVVSIPEGVSTEVAIIGREGLAGALTLIGPAPPQSHCFIQMEASAYRIPFSDLKAAFFDSPEIRTRILEFVQQQSMTMCQISACNKLHQTEARLARWLLMVQERIQHDVLQLTQEFLAEMLGSQRTTVALAAGMLQSAGFIEYKRGRVKIIAREELMQAACDCYSVTHRLLDRLYKA